MLKENLFVEDMPENLGISSQDIENFIDDVNRYGFYMHSFMIMRYGKVAAEGYFAPFKKNELHRAYSISKTFTGTAIGMLIDEGKISLDDCVFKFFPDKCPEKLHPYIKETKIRDLLTMSTPFCKNSYSGLKPDMDWAWTYFNTEPDHPSGTIFRYDTAGTHVLSVIVERVTGKPYLEYLKDKGLREMGFSENAWCIKAPEGNSWGGAGIICSMRDLARLGLLYLNGGNINGKQYLSKEYVHSATSKQADNNVFGYEKNYLYGYGYKMWITRDNSFSFMGMGDQEVICIPDKDFMFVCNSDNQGNAMSEAMLYELLWKNIVEKLEDKPMKENKAAYNSLRGRLSSLTLYKPQGEKHSPMEKELDAAEFRMNINNMGITKLTLHFLPEYAKLCYETPRGDRELIFGYGEYKESIFPETHYSGDTIGVGANRGYRCVASGVWTEENKLSIRVNIIDDYFANLNITLGFKGNEIGVCMMKTAEWFLNEYQGFAGGRRYENS